jgi:polysaccharide export outer membrane protein
MLEKASNSAPRGAFRTRRAAAGRLARLLRCVAAAGLAACLAGCAAGPMSGSPDAVRQAQDAAQNYRLSAGDKVHVAVFNEDNLSGDFVVAPDGMVTIPLAGGIRAAGLTLPQFQQAVTARLKDGVVQQPNVTITANELRPYYILGEVNKPGRYAYTPDLTVLNAVATAEGFTYRADMSTVYVRHADGPSEQEERLTATTAVLPGDTIRVSQRFF